MLSAIVPYARPPLNMWFEYPELLLLLLMSCMCSLYVILNVKIVALRTEYIVCERSKPQYYTKMGRGNPTYNKSLSFFWTRSVGWEWDIVCYLMYYDLRPVSSVAVTEEATTWWQHDDQKHDTSPESYVNR
jgi:hypothetical protein